MNFGLPRSELASLMMRFVSLTCAVRLFFNFVELRH